MKRLALTLLAASTLSWTSNATAHELGGSAATGVLHATASASVDAKPDRAMVTAGVRSQAKTAREAMQQNSDLMNAVYEALAEAGIAERDIRTSNLNLSPQYNYESRRNGGQPEVTGYQASNQVTVTTSEIEEIGMMLDVLLQAGVNTINGVSFMVSDQDSAQSKARTEAIEKARDKAADMAEAAGVDLGKLLSMTEGSVPGQMYSDIVVTGARLEAGNMAPPISAGQSEIRSTVTLTYAID